MGKRTEYRDNMPTPVDVDVTSSVPLPAPYKREASLPFDKMKVGDSFFVPAPVGKAKVMANRLRNAAGYHRRHRQPGFFITSRVENGGVRVWRIEEPANYSWMRDRALKGNEARRKAKGD